MTTEKEMAKCICALADALETLGNDEVDKKLKIQAALRALLTDSGVSTAPPMPTALAVKKRSKSKVNSVKFRGHLRKLVKKAPERIADLIEPLRQCGVLLSKDDVEAALQIKNGFMKSPKQYREYPNDRWGLLSYPMPQLVTSG